MRKGNGFTLVEIIVSIAIGSIVLLIAGGIILSSSNFLMTTTDMDIDKRAVDSIVDFVRGEIEYSTDVRFVQHGDELAPNYTEDSDWHYFYIKDNELYRDGAKVFAKSFTNNKSLSISMKGNGTSTSNHRLDIKYALLDNKNEISYSSRDTVMFLNLSVSQEILNQGIYSADYKDISDNGYWLFYTKKAKNLTSIPEEVDNNTGTVADQIKFLNVFNNRNELFNYDWQSGGKQIYKYEFVFYNGYWWQLLSDSGLYGTKNAHTIEVPDQCHKFKRISAEFVHTSAYEKGDVVIYNNQYYICKADFINQGMTIGRSYTPDQNFWPANHFWEKIDEKNLKDENGHFKDNSSHITDPKRSESMKNEYMQKTILNKLDGINLDIIPEYKKEDNAKIPVVIGAPKQSDFYKVTKTDPSTNQKIVKYYIKLENNGSEPGIAFDKKVGWQEITMEYAQYSAYNRDDMIFQPYSIPNNVDIAPKGARVGYLISNKDIKVVIDFFTSIEGYGYNNDDWIWKYN